MHGTTPMQCQYSSILVSTLVQCQYRTVSASPRCLNTTPKRMCAKCHGHLRSHSQVIQELKHFVDMEGRLFITGRQDDEIKRERTNSIFLLNISVHTHTQILKELFNRKIEIKNKNPLPHLLHTP